MEKVSYDMCVDHRDRNYSDAELFLGWVILELVSQDKTNSHPFTTDPDNRFFNVELKIDGKEYSLKDLSAFINSQLEHMVDARANKIYMEKASKLDMAMYKLLEKIKKETRELFPNAYYDED